MDMCTKPQIKRNILNHHFEGAKDLFIITENNLCVCAVYAVYESRALENLHSIFVHKMFIIVV